MVCSLLLGVAMSVCEVRDLVFANGFRARMPQAVCVTRVDNADSTIYQFTLGPEAPPFLEAYDGNAADFFYFVPEGGVGKSDACNGTIHINQVTRKTIIQIGGASETRDGRCGEVLIRRPAKNGAVSSAALHFWYSRLTVEEEKLARGIIDAVEAK